jgi:hypothetical protein
MDIDLCMSARRVLCLKKLADAQVEALTLARQKTCKPNLEKSTVHHIKKVHAPRNALVLYCTLSPYRFLTSAKACQLPPIIYVVCAPYMLSVPRLNSIRVH